MAKRISFRRGLSSILFWSIISAAFIGPGTVTTASRAGAAFGAELLWALVFSILATIVLQEAAARITIASGKNLGEIIAVKFSGGRTGASRIQWLVFLSVAFGCAAYQAGNMLGAVSGILLFDSISRRLGTILLFVICFALLWSGSFKTIARLLGLVVALMGVVFIYVAAYTPLPIGRLFHHVVTPVIPSGGSLLVIGLIGTTIVPYNLFLASGISQDQDIREMRLGISIAILIGGMISVAILIVGTRVVGPFSFQALADALGSQLGKWGAVLFGIGLAAAGISSSITSPLAAAITARSLLGGGQESWTPRGKYFRLVWIIILSVGLLFGLTDVRPVPAIILAQAINGILLPLVAVFLFLAVNDAKLLGKEYANGYLSNALMLVIVGVSCFLGLNNLWKAILSASGRSSDAAASLPILLFFSIVIVLALAWNVFRPQHHEPNRTP